MTFPLKFAWKDLGDSIKRVWLFCACLVFGVCLVMASAGLYQMLDRSLLADTRAFFGGDVEIESNKPLDAEVIDWISDSADISLTRELNTMVSTSSVDFMLVELLSIDQAYPLYGTLKLDSDISLQNATSFRDGEWGVAIDPILAQRLGLSLGNKILVGQLEMVVRALVLEQPDRRLNASWRGAPVLLSDAALDASGLIGLGSRIEYEYRIRTQQNANEWKQTFIQAFPDSDWEIQTFEDRSERIAERLSQIASGLLIVAFSTLFIGGIGIFNSISVYLKSKRSTIATLKACGLRDRQIAKIYILQIGLLAALSGLIGILIGASFAWIGSTVLAQELPISIELNDFISAALLSWLFGMLTAYTFALPALGKALNIDVAHLFRGTENPITKSAHGWRLASATSASLLSLLVLFAIPSLIFGLAFLAVVAFCILFFEGVVRGLKMLAQSLEHQAFLKRSATLRFALANMHRPGTPLRATLLSLGAALTLLVSCSVVVVSLLRMIHETIPEESPALILYDVVSGQKDEVESRINAFPSTQKATLSPIVRGRIAGINDVPIRELAQERASDFGTDSDAIDWQEMARDEHKLSYLSDNIDGIRIIEGSLWQQASVSQSVQDAKVDFLFAMEDREAEQMELKPGDRVSFSIVGKELTGLLTGIYSQRGIQTRFWFEAIFSDGALDPFINKYVGTVYMSDSEALALQTELARNHPNVITVRTKELVASASELLGKATNGLVVLSAISLIVSLMVLASVMAAGREKQTYDAIVLHCIGARLSYIRNAIRIEYALLAFIVSVFSILLGLSIAALILRLQLKILEVDVYWLGALVAFASATLVFSLGAHYLFSRLKLRPAHLLRDSF